MRKISYVVFENIRKRYKRSSTDVIKEFNLSIDKGEFIVIVGPSGSGKSTLLELICGFEEITDGHIEIDNKVINQMEPKNRDVAMVFQSYALFPHLTTYENIAFGMKIRKMDKLDIDKKVRWAANILELNEFLDVKPKKLSGGQRQRVALARAIVREPKLFLMDEPLSNLDPKLRYSTCNEITNLHKEINATTIYVTHDQVEALTMADRIVVLNDGIIQQVGTPMELYSKPKNTFVATFIGKPQMNLFDFIIKDDKLQIADSMIFDLSKEFSFLEKNKKYILGIRAENIIHTNSDRGSVRAKIEKVEYLGSEIILYLEYEKCKFTSKTYNIKEFKIGEYVNITFDFEKVSIFDNITREIINNI